MSRYQPRYYGKSHRLRRMPCRLAYWQTYMLHADYLKMGSEYFVAWYCYIDNRGKQAFRPHLEVQHV